MKINVINIKNQDMWHDIALALDLLTVIIMAMSQQIVQTKSHHQAHQQGTEITVPMQDNMINPHPIVTTEIGTITVIIRTDIGLAG